MLRWQTLAVAMVVAVLPAASLDAQSCVPGPMPSPETSVGWAVGNWPPGEAIRFAAVPSLTPRAYVVQISRTSPRGDAIVDLVALVRERTCNRWNRDQEWRFPLSPQEASLFFERTARIETHWVPDESGEIVVDGTGFEYEHRIDGAVRRLQLSAMATGQSARLSGLILSLMTIARGQIPDSPSWYD